jgi:hypothetical protein
MGLADRPYWHAKPASGEYTRHAACLPHKDGTWGGDLLLPEVVGHLVAGSGGFWDSNPSIGRLVLSSRQSSELRNWGGATAGKNRASTSVMVDDGCPSERRCLVERIIVALSKASPLHDLSPPSRYSRVWVPQIGRPTPLSLLEA